MKTQDLVFLLIVGVLGYVVYQKLSAATPPSAAGANLSAGALPVGTPDIATSIARVAQSVFNGIGAFAQNTPKTT